MIVALKAKTSSDSQTTKKRSNDYLKVG